MLSISISVSRGEVKISCNVSFQQLSLLWIIRGTRSNTIMHSENPPSSFFYPFRNPCRSSKNWLYFSAYATKTTYIKLRNNSNWKLSFILILFGCGFYPNLKWKNGLIQNGEWRSLEVVLTRNVLAGCSFFFFFFFLLLVHRPMGVILSVKREVGYHIWLV